jgi:hypothetical protein
VPRGAHLPRVAREPRRAPLPGRGAAWRVGLLALALGVLHTLLGAYACGDPITGSKGEGEPCTRTAECAAELTCSGGVCRGPVDGGMTPGD